VALTTHSHLAPKLKKECRTIPVFALCDRYSHVGTELNDTKQLSAVNEYKIVLAFDLLRTTAVIIGAMCYAAEKRRIVIRQFFFQVHYYISERVILLITLKNLSIFVRK
jgi:hypothetical protein